MFGVKVRDEVRNIHQQLYKVTYYRWTEEEERTRYVTVNGELVPETYTVNMYYLRVDLTTKSFDSYLQENKATLFKAGQEQHYNTLNEIGGMNLRQELGSPFVGLDWKNVVTSRYGYRVHPIHLDKRMHTGIDIAMPEGTPINAVMSGKAVQVGFDADDYGNYIVIDDGKRKTRYAHCQSISVLEGTEVKKGDIIGFVGNTGTSTGDHLHLEFYKDGNRLNPIFYLLEK